MANGEPLPVWEPFKDAMLRTWQKFMVWYEIEWAKPFDWNSPRGFLWATVPAMIGFVLLAFSLDVFMLIYHRRQEYKAKAKVAEKAQAGGEKKTD
mmetsp:Transcript_39210/g.53249  ORF Transcript_39210/g.53249 Transcript_39210/m.53249 type:complete len:95 (-) Transcript_39210:789-1073(-)